MNRSRGPSAPVLHLAGLTLCAAAALAAPAAVAEPPVHVHVDVHLPALPEAPPPEAPHHHRHAHPPPAESPPPREPPRGGGREHRGARFHVPPDRVPGRGLCRIWYDDLPPDRQPPAMACERAHHLARRHGGRVIWREAHAPPDDGAVTSASYGRVDFGGVPPDRLPPPGSCRVWLEGVPPDRQPPPGACDHAEREARRTGGRLLYMPAP